MRVYHFELRKFPHTLCRYNQSERQMLALAVPWTREEWVEAGERKWNVNESKLTVLEGPELSLQDMAMSRGWRNARRRGEDVTERVLGAARELGGGKPAAPEPAPSATGPAPGPADAAQSAPDAQLLVDSLGLELLTLLDRRPASLARVWALAHERLGPGRPASESLALAERATRSLLERGLVVLLRGAGDAAQGNDGVGGSADREELAGEQIEAALRAIDGWSATGADSLAIARGSQAWR
ncbi:MAG TPA: hypothetical protein VK707_01740 [Solirubrobacteraceae bacterium]|nr:hypothetical protein [Solirubrobacteraceae bacterium]